MAGAYYIVYQASRGVTIVQRAEQHQPAIKRLADKGRNPNTTQASSPKRQNSFSAAAAAGTHDVVYRFKIRTAQPAVLLVQRADHEQSALECWADEERNRNATLLSIVLGMICR